MGSVENGPDTPTPGTKSATPASPSSGGFKVKIEKCSVCGKSVYAMDKMVADGIIFHKNCMKCEHCKKTLGLGNFAALNGKYYCKPHFKQLFQSKGNYSDGFGEEAPTAKWDSKAVAYASGTPGADFTKPASKQSPKPAAEKKPTPTVTEPVVEEPAAEEPAAEEPAAEEPVAEEPVAEEPAAEEPAEEPEEEKPASLTNRMAAFSVENGPDTPTPGTKSATPASPSSGGFKVKIEKCSVCGKSVYAMDKMVADGIIFHKNCMKCEHCKKTLGLGNFAALNGKY